ncbi:hypothetical protein AN639_05585 [Candidatus Epulonipiscium fishelsonii]|uniref:Uncharacterized protein n=1 Tax=Candidatus Epulonipiscium fishelsonii TaxID=77094 RepID=A0ACC8X982_9FIRM|nr:hypothetical protein AN396_10620 [Epulopiscium sp. SCG-B11WGA-EpuloA1]ONI39920.1 hypothetical protein AN639_05585 [Epulopiscium sp. SCG-B05WGA-EpuloA1]
MIKNFKVLCRMLTVLFLIGCQSVQIFATDIYPMKDITVIVPFNAGGGIDVSARTLVTELEEYFPEISFVVQNITGASGTIGAEELFNADPDGYTIMAAGNGFNVSSVTGLFSRSVEDYEMIAQYTTSQLGLYVRADSPFQTYEDLIEFARQNPSTLKMGTLTATMNQFAILAMEEKEDIKFKQIVVGGDQPPQPELLSGRIDAYVVAVSQNTTYIDSGDFRCLGVFAGERAPSLPDVPTFMELGIEEDYQLTFGLWAPPGTPREFTSIISEATKSVVANPDFQNTMTGMGYSAQHIDGPEYAELMSNSLNAMKELSASLVSEEGLSVDPYVGAYGIPNFVLITLLGLFILKIVITVGIKKQPIKFKSIELFKGTPIVFLGALTLYVLVFEFLGFIISSTVFLAGSTLYLQKGTVGALGKKDYIIAFLIAIIFSVGVFFFFTEGAKITLPVSFLGI